MNPQSKTVNASHYLWTSEYVSPGHPDKIADQISDTVLDLYLERDPRAKVACETMVKNNNVIVAGEISSRATVSSEELQSAIRDTIRGIGYTDSTPGFSGDSCTITMDIHEQSPEINKAVDQQDHFTAGDQGIMFGYATRQTPERMPAAITLAKRIIDEAYSGRGQRYAFRPDMKSQVTLQIHNGTIEKVHSVVLSVCHDESLSLTSLRQLFHDELFPRVLRALPEHLQRLFTADTTFYINPAGEWNIGGPVADCGLTGRKIVVDQYGADCPIGGGAFSGKDPSKVDRSAAYMARHLALRTLQEHPDAESIMVQLAYAIGEARPVSQRIVEPRTGVEYLLSERDVDLCTPSVMITALGLNKPIYKATSSQGHFGVPSTTVNGITYHSWERVD